MNRFLAYLLLFVALPSGIIGYRLGTWRVKPPVVTIGRIQPGFDEGKVVAAFRLSLPEPKIAQARKVKPTRGWRYIDPKRRRDSDAPSCSDGDNFRWYTVSGALKKCVNGKISQEVTNPGDWVSR